MQLTNMKLPPVKEKPLAESAPSMPREEYPYGLRIHLDKDQLEQLGITKLPETGVEVSLVAKATVTSVNESAHDSGSGKNVYRSVSLQITDLALAPPKASKNTEDVFYSKDEEA